MPGFFGFAEVEASSSAARVAGRGASHPAPKAPARPAQNAPRGVEPHAPQQQPEKIQLGEGHVAAPSTFRVPDMPTAPVVDTVPRFTPPETTLSRSASLQRAADTAPRLEIRGELPRRAARPDAAPRPARVHTPEETAKPAALERPAVRREPPLAKLPSAEADAAAARLLSSEIEALDRAVLAQSFERIEQAFAKRLSSASIGSIADDEAALSDRLASLDSAESRLVASGTDASKLAVRRIEAEKAEISDEQLALERQKQAIEREAALKRTEAQTQAQRAEALRRAERTIQANRAAQNKRVELALKQNFTAATIKNDQLRHVASVAGMRNAQQQKLVALHVIAAHLSSPVGAAAKLPDVAAPELLRTVAKPTDTPNIQRRQLVGAPS